MMNLIAPPRPAALRPHEVLVWRGVPCWRTMATRVFHLRAVVLYACALILANAVAARMQHLSPGDAVRGIAPVLVLCGLLVALTVFAAWATGRTTLYTITDQRVLLQYGVALPATLALPLRVIGTVGVSDAAVGDVPLRLKPGHRVSLVKLWPHLRPWSVAHPEPMLRALPDAKEAASLLSHAVAAAQAVEHAAPARLVQRAMAPLALAS